MILYLLEHERHLGFVDSLHVMVHQVMVIQVLEVFKEDVLGLLPFIQVVGLSGSRQDLIDFLEIM